jgi:uncharacterized protein YqhQ
VERAAEFKKARSPSCSGLLYTFSPRVATPSEIVAEAKWNMADRRSTAFTAYRLGSNLCNSTLVIGSLVFLHQVGMRKLNYSTIPGRIILLEVYLPLCYTVTMSLTWLCLPVTRLLLISEMCLQG